jgi:hypothetical protein
MRELERRARPRFSLQLPLVIEDSPTGAEFRSLTRDVSARGVFFYTHARCLQLSARITFSMILPAEITGSEQTRVLCEGKVIRLEEGAQTGTGVAATIETYDF